MLEGEAEVLDPPTPLLPNLFAVHTQHTDETPHLFCFFRYEQILTALFVSVSLSQLDHGPGIKLFHMQSVSSSGKLCMVTCLTVQSMIKLTRAYAAAFSLL